MKVSIFHMYQKADLMVHIHRKLKGTNQGLLRRELFMNGYMINQFLVS